MKKEIPGVGIVHYKVLFDRGYGLEVTLKTADGEERSTVRNLTTSRDNINRLTKLLWKNTVMPCTLGEIVEELL